MASLRSEAGTRECRQLLCCGARTTGLPGRRSRRGCIVESRIAHNTCRLSREVAAMVGVESTLPVQCKRDTSLHCKFLLTLQQSCTPLRLGRECCWIPDHNVHRGKDIVGTEHRRCDCRQLSDYLVR